MKNVTWLLQGSNHGPSVLVNGWPSGKLPFDCQKLAKILTFFQKKIAKNFHFFQKKLPMAIFLNKMKIFGNFFRKNLNFLASFWQSNGNFPEGQLYMLHWIWDQSKSQNWVNLGSLFNFWPENWPCRGLYNLVPNCFTFGTNLMWQLSIIIISFVQNQLNRLKTLKKIFIQL